LPELISETLLVVAPFKDRGVDYVPGDRLPIRHLHIRQIAREHPELFAMEYAIEPVDLEWLAGLEVLFEDRYREFKHAREKEKVRQQRAIRQELESQDIPDHELEKRFKKQEAEREKREQEAKEERERESVERNIAVIGESGFHF
jgi:hypothetical protein